MNKFDFYLAVVSCSYRSTSQLSGTHKVTDTALGVSTESKIKAREAANRKLRDWGYNPKRDDLEEMWFYVGSENEWQKVEG